MQQLDIQPEMFQQLLECLRVRQFYLQSRTTAHLLQKKQYEGVAMLHPRLVHRYFAPILR